MPAVDMVEEKNDLVVRIDLPGFTKENINLRIVEDILTITNISEERIPPEIRETIEMLQRL
jgi:HSP20 family molecular chaperone IbpA